MMARPKGKRNEAVIRTAIQRFLNGEKTGVIAKSLNVSQPTISYWLNRYGRKLFGEAFQSRKPGRPKLKEPSVRDLAIIAARNSGGKTKTMEEIGAAHGITRARVSTILSTWKKRSA